MKTFIIIVTTCIILGIASCWIINSNTQVNYTADGYEKISDNPEGDTLLAAEQPVLTTTNKTQTGGPATDTAKRDLLILFAKEQLGIPYKYASADPSGGFDCSGFLYYVFHHFNIDVPRSSREYLNFGKTIPVSNVQAGDFLLFTGTDSTIWEPGHVGLVTTNDATGIQFIHSSSGKANGVTISPLQGYYQTRFMKAISILK